MNVEISALACEPVKYVWVIERTCLILDTSNIKHYFTQISHAPGIPLQHMSNFPSKVPSMFTVQYKTQVVVPVIARNPLYDPKTSHYSRHRTHTPNKASTACPPRSCRELYISSTAVLTYSARKLPKLECFLTFWNQHVLKFEGRKDTQMVKYVVPVRIHWQYQYES